MNIATILKLESKDRWPIYRELVWAGLEYRRESRLKYFAHYLFPQPPRPGRPRDICKGLLIARLRRLYKQCTGRDPVCYWNDMHGEYCGNFRWLCERVAKERVSASMVKEVLNSIRRR